ncbi:hypothetical protein [Brachybacterium sp. GPGPB12]|uniref:hypothetical protein n=1 Tax=Brachybacterium sp. GPGPB12 TaxID=3023517 RepID=UPI0031342C8F
MIDRKDLGSWMDGPPGEAGYVKGSALGLPATGRGAVAPFWRRPLSLIVDWGLCVGISALLFGGDPLANLILFAAVNVLFLTLFGVTPGQFLLQVRVVPVSGRDPMLAARGGAHRADACWCSRQWSGTATPSPCTTSSQAPRSSPSDGVLRFACAAGASAPASPDAPCRPAGRLPTSSR